jgi:hypothetical protein
MTTGASPQQERATPTDQIILALARLRDPEGVLSIHTESAADAGVRHAPRGPQIALRNALHALRERVRAEGPRSRAAALEARLDALRSELAELTDPSLSGRGRALFAGIASGEVRRLALLEPLPTYVTLDFSASLRPLLSPLDAGRPAGLVAVSALAVRAVDWYLGQAADVLAIAFDDETGEWRRLKGPAAPGPRGMEMAAHRDLFLRRLQEHRERFVAGAADHLLDAAGSLSWERLVVAGDPELAAPLVERLAGNLEVLEVAAVPGGDLSAHELADLVAPAMRAAREREHVALAEKVRDAALAAHGSAALGVEETLAALVEGRVHALLLDPRIDIPGVAAPDGRLAREGEILPGVPPEELRAEPHLVERAVERALETDARVVPLEPAAADLLAQWEGMAAVLRW